MNLGANNVEQERQHGLVECGIPLGVGIVAGRFEFGQNVIAAACAASLGGTPPTSDDLVSHDAAEPIAKTSQRGIVAEHGFLLEDRQHHFLNNFFGRVFFAALLSCNREHERPIAAEEFIPNDRIGAVAKAFEQARAGVCVGNHRRATSTSETFYLDASLKAAVFYFAGRRTVKKSQTDLRSVAQIDSMDDNETPFDRRYESSPTADTSFPQQESPHERHLPCGNNTRLGAPDVQATPDAKTQLYVKTVPPGAAVIVDDKTLGESPGLFDVAAGTHELTLRKEGFIVESRSIEVREGEITRIDNVQLQRPSDKRRVLSYVGESTQDMQSWADSGHAVLFERPKDMKSIVAVKLFGSRYGYPRAPNEDFHIYLLDQNQKVLEQVAVPYRKIAKGDMRWYTLEFPAIEVPEKFFVAVWFNAEPTKGVYVGKQCDVQQTHSYVGLPDTGYKKVEPSYEWMIRAVVTGEDGKKPTHPKVTTYGEEKAADTESHEAQPEGGPGARQRRTRRPCGRGATRAARSVSRRGSAASRMAR